MTISHDYDAWGVPELISGSFDLDFQYTGHFHHEKSGLHLAPFRAYDARLGRWISRDPIAEDGGINLYGYVEGNPVNIFDPDGLASWSDHWQALKSWTWSEAGESLALGAMATADGFNPFANPLEDRGMYGPCTAGVGFSRGAGGVSREVALLATGTQAYRMLGRGVLRSSGVTGASVSKQVLVGRAGANAVLGRQAFLDVYGSGAVGQTAFAAFEAGKAFILVSLGVDGVSRVSDIVNSFSGRFENCR